MLSNEELSRMTNEELTAAEQKSKSRKIPVSFGIGFLVGLAVYGATHKGGFLLTILLLFFALQVASRYTQNQKNIQAELSRRNAAPL